MKRLFLACLIAGLGVAWGCSPRSVLEPAPLPVCVRNVATGAAGGGVRFSATLRPESQLDLAFKVGGYVREVLQRQGADGRLRSVQEGDVVTAGTVLARLREADYQAKVDEARSAAAEARAALAQAQAQSAEARAARAQAAKEFERGSSLLANRGITNSEFDALRARQDASAARIDAAHATAEMCQARVERAKAQLQLAELALTDCALVAPAGSTLLRRAVEPGSLAGPGAPAFVLASTGSMKTVFGVPDRMLPRLELGSEQVVTVEAAGGDFHGRITRISPAADPVSRVYEVEISLPNPDGRLRIGMIASLTIHCCDEGPQLPLAPLAAIVRPRGAPDRHGVYVVEGVPGKELARLRVVELGELVGNSVAITSGLAVGQRLVVTGATLLVDGQPVQVVP